MILYFTFSNSNSKNRSKYLRGALIRNGCNVKRCLPENLNDSDSIWFHSVSHLENSPIESDIIKNMRAFKGKIVFFQNSDELDFMLSNVPDDLAEKASLFLMNHYYEDTSLIPKAIINKLGFVNPIIKPMKPHYGKPLDKRNNNIIFYGAKTGFPNSMDVSNPRINAVNILKNANFGFKGGLINQNNFPVPVKYQTQAIPQKTHDLMLRDSKICLALWGNCPVSYRFFEGLAYRCLVLAQEIEHVKFASAGLIEGKHYISFKSDLSNLSDKVKYYLMNLDEAQEIANAGYKHFIENFAYSGVNLPQPLFNEIINSWKGILQQSNISSVNYKIRNIILNFVKSL